MTNTRFYDNHESLVKNRAQSTERVGNTYHLKPINVFHGRPSNLMTTVKILPNGYSTFENPVVGKRKDDTGFLTSLPVSTTAKSGDANIWSGDSLFQARGQNLEQP